MRRIILNIILIAGAAMSLKAVESRPDSLKRIGQPIDPAIANEKVIIGNDTVSIILPQKNYGRYDRGLYNFLFIPKGQWSFGLTASYGEFDAKDVQMLSVIKDFNFHGKMYSIRPTISYFIRNNQSLGVKLSYVNRDGALGSLAMDLGDDLNFNLRNVSYSSTSYAIGICYRNYVGLSNMKRFAVFNEVDLSFASGTSRFIRSYNEIPRDTKTNSSEVSLNFSPGLCVFVMDNVNFNVSFGVFGLHLRHERQYTDQVDEGTRLSSGANFKFNIFNINFGLGINI
ncbi:MAG: hypothetical protein K2J18_02905 [Paramuribaculum sp.]|nr:hypothetical protein [Paramuribaculum sp.]MDE7470443.1 hypothetical protein [Paramuribaculum sp.]